MFTHSRKEANKETQVFRENSDLRPTGVRAGGAREAAAPPNFGQLRFFGQEEKIWAKPVFKDVFMFIELF